MLALKNAIMYYIVKARDARKVPKLQEILEQAIERQKRIKEESRKRRQNMTLDQLEPHANYLTDEQFEAIRENAFKVKETAMETDFQLAVLSRKVNILLRDPKDGRKKVDHGHHQL